MIGESIPSRCAALVDLQEFFALPLAGMRSPIKMHYLSVYEMCRFQEK